MDVTPYKKSNEKLEIQKFLNKHFSSSLLDQDIITKILGLLHTKGKIFSTEENTFSWSTFYMYVSSLTPNEDTCNKSLITNAAAIELLILATDIVDEIVDEDDDLLAGMTLAEAVTLSNTLLLEAFQLILDHAPMENYRILSDLFKNLKIACNGQWKDLKLVVSETVPTEDDYFKVIEQKSSSLIRLVCQLGYPSSPNLLTNIATNIGVAGQLRNDATDIFLDSKSDLIKKKATLPVIKAIEYSREQDKNWLLKKIQELTNDNQLLKKEIREYIAKTGAIDYCFILAKFYMKRAIEELYIHFPNQEDVIRKIKNHIEGQNNEKY